jgi:hypothetical protein
MVIKQNLRVTKGKIARAARKGGKGGKGYCHKLGYYEGKSSKSSF